MKIIITAIAALFIVGPAIAAQPQRTVVTVMQGPVLCPNQSDLVVFSTSAQLMPGCGRIAHDTPAVQVYPPEQGIVGPIGRWQNVVGARDVHSPMIRWD